MMKHFARKAALVLLACSLSLPAQAAFAASPSIPTTSELSAEERIPIAPSESITVENGDGTFTHFVLDPLAPEQPELEIDPAWWRMVYDAAKRETERILPGEYAERTEDIILLLHSRPMYPADIELEKFRPAGGRFFSGELVAAAGLGEKQALDLATAMFPEVDDSRTDSVQGWYHYARNGMFDVMALSYLDAGEIAIHELAHAFTDYDTTSVEREIIARGVVEFLLSNDEFAALLSGGALTLPMSAPGAVAFEDFAGITAPPTAGTGAETQSSHPSLVP